VPKAARKAQEIRSNGVARRPVIVARMREFAGRAGARRRDGERNRDVRRGHGKGPDFFAFYRSMDGVVL